MPGYSNISNVKRKQKSIIIGYSFATWCETAAGIRFYIVYIVWMSRIKGFQVCPIIMFQPPLICIEQNFKIDVWMSDRIYIPWKVSK